MKKGTDTTEEEALKILEGNWDHAAYSSTEKERQDFDEATKMVKDFLVRQNGRKEKIIDVESWVMIELDEKQISGKVDRIDEDDGSLIVIDFKSSKDQTSRPQLKKDFQMALYTIGVERTYEKPVKEVGHWYLRMDKEWMVSLTQEERDEVLTRAKKIIESIEAGEFPGKPNFQSCKYCDYQELCEDR